MPLQRGKPAPRADGRARVPAVPSAEFPCITGETGEPGHRAGGEWPPRAWPSGTAASPSANPVSASRDDEMKKSFWVPITLALAAYLLLPLPGLSAPLSQRIEQKRAQIEQRKQKEGVLTTTIQASARGSTASRARSGHPAAPRAAPRQPRPPEGRAARGARPPRGGARPARAAAQRARTARRVLAARLVEIYKADTPDALTVVLEADGFGDLLERAEFLDRISDQDREITDRVRGLRDQAAGPGRRAGRARGARAARRRAHPARARPDRRRAGASSCRRATSSPSARADRRGALAQVRDSRDALEGDLARARGRAGARRRRRSRAPAARARSGRAAAR